MARNKHSSPLLQLTISEEQVAQAVQSNSGGCLIADAIKKQYPNLVNVTVDMATIRVSDRKRGERYIYLTPPAAQHVLLSFDQGWPNPADELTIKGAVQIVPIRQAGDRPQQARATRGAEGRAAGTAGRRRDPHTCRPRGTDQAQQEALDRPSSAGPAEVATHRGRVTVRGGRTLSKVPRIRTCFVAGTGTSAPSSPIPAWRSARR